MTQVFRDATQDAPVLVVPSNKTVRRDLTAVGPAEFPDAGKGLAQTNQTPLTPAEVEDTDGVRVAKP